MAVTPKVRELEIKVQVRPEHGQTRTSYSDILVIDITKKIQIKDAVHLDMPVRVVKSDSERVKEGVIGLIKLVQGSPITLVLKKEGEENREEFVDVLSPLDDSVLLILEDGEEINVVPENSVKGRLWVSDGDNWESNVTKWSKKDGHTEVKTITTPSVRGVHYKQAKPV